MEVTQNQSCQLSSPRSIYAIYLNARNNLVLESNTTSQVQVTEWPTYRINWTTVDIGFKSIVVCCDYEYVIWFKYNLDQVSHMT